MSGPELSRRAFLQASGALVVGCYIPPRIAFAAGAAAGPFAPNAFVRIAADDTVTILVNKSEMGQGVYTSLPMLIAEELDATWTRIRVESAPAEAVYKHTVYGVYLTGGSTSVASSWQQFREAGATARALLVQAAARTWQVAPDDLVTEEGFVIDRAADRRLSYGQLAAAAATLEPPAEVKLKDPPQFRLIGRNVKRIEGPEKVTGRAEFGLDVSLPGMLTAVIARPPVCGGSVISHDAQKTLAIPGVEKVKPVSSGVAVIAADFWTAKRGRDALEIEWDDGPNGALSTTDLQARYRALAEQPGAVAEHVGEPADALQRAAKRVEAVYEVPFLAHAPMEPLNCTAHVTETGCDIWAGTQFQTQDQIVAGRILGRPPETVRIHTTLLGGGFGRRATPTSDFVADAVEVAKGEPVPVKTVWTREEDIQCGYYRPMFVHKLTAGLDERGQPVAWQQRLVGQSIMTGTDFEQALVHEGVDHASVEGATDMPYAIPNRRVELHSPELGIPVLWWRSVGHTHTAFAGESFLDEVAHAGGHDPYELRRRLLAGNPRHRRVLEVAAEKAGWGKPLPEGRARGIAMRKSFNSLVAEVAEVSVTDRGQVRVHKVVCAVDCGIAVNPWGVEAQLRSAVVYGLSAALYGELTLERGRVKQSNFHDYRVLRMNEMPEIDVHIVASSEAPTGVGEPGVPPIAPAVTNAIFRLTGQRIRSLPIRLA